MYIEHSKIANKLKLKTVIITCALSLLYYKSTLTNEIKLKPIHEIVSP